MKHSASRLTGSNETRVGHIMTPFTEETYVSVSSRFGLRKLSMQRCCGLYKESASVKKNQSNPVGAVYFLQSVVEAEIKPF